MKRTPLFLLLAAFAACSSVFLFEKKKPAPVPNGMYPSDWFFMQRAYPYGKIPLGDYKNAVLQAAAMKAGSYKMANPAWKLAGPTNIGGRISDIEMDPTSTQVMYAGLASGGIFKSTNAGSTWSPVFDNAASLSIGDLAVAPSNPNIIFAGTGESNGGGGSQTYDGLGVYKSIDAGVTWSYTGLDSVGSIGRIVINPKNPNKVFVAAMGDLFGKTPQRGIYRSTNGGSSWQKVLFVTDSTGGVDLAINPQNPDTVYAATWHRIRTPYYHTYGGVTSNIYRSFDGGTTWTKLTNGIPANVSTNGRIGIGLCNSSPNVIYAIYADDIGNFKGLYKSTDHGSSWVKTTDGALSGMYSTYGWWNGKLTVDPNNANVVYTGGLNAYKTTNGGGSYSTCFSSSHVDHHAYYVHPLNSNLVINGNDGGIYISNNGGSTATKVAVLPATQFYTCEIDNTVPARLYGGAQDNNVIRTLTGALNNWASIVGGDGFYTLVDPNNNTYVYGESQYGAFVRSTNGGSSFSGGTSGISGSDRKNWCTPVVFDPNNPMILYYGSQRLYKSTDRAVSWTAISPDLTNGASSGNLVYNTITTIAVAKSNANVIYVGTDDGRVQVTTNGGTNWTNITGTLPKRWITRVAVDPANQAVAYVTISGYRWNEYMPHVFKTTNTGASWTDITNNLPGAPVNDIIIDPNSKDSTYYVATDVGVYYTKTAGSSWMVLGDSLPNVPVNDLVLHNPTRTLVAGTFGRSMYKLDLNLLTTSVKDIAAADKNPEAYPNPFRDYTKIVFHNPSAQQVKVHVYDMEGRLVSKIFEGELAEGPAEFEWNGTVNGWAPAAKGTYFCRMIAANGTSVVKLLKASE